MKVPHLRWFVLFFLVGCNCWMVARTYRPIAGGTAHVISPEGLVLRSGPSKSASKVTVLPYLSSLVVVDSKDQRLDSLPAVKDSRWEGGHISRVGHWVKAKAGGKTGYVLDIFLLTQDEFEAWKADSEAPAAIGINTDYLLFEHQVECVANLAPKAGYQWMGVYVEGGKVVIKPAKLHQHASRYDAVVEGQMFIETYADDNEHLRFLIGSKASGLAARTTEALYDYWVWLEEDADEKKQKALLAGLGIEWRSNSEAPEDSYADLLWVNTDKKQAQVLTIPELDQAMAAKLELVADLDGDGLKDYIVSYGDGKGMTVLYLSSRAKPGKAVAPVAAWDSAYCC